MFGARKNQKKEIGGKPKYLGMILVLALLLIMAIVALSSTFFFSDETSFFSSGDENEFAAAAVPDVVSTTPEADPAIPPDAPIIDEPLVPTSPEAVPDIPVDDPVDTPPDATELADVEPEPPTDPDAPVVAEVLDDNAAQAHYAATGIWQKAPEPPGEPQSSRIDDLYVASIDPAISSQDAVALPSGDARSSDARPASPLPPAAAGTDFALNDNGLVTPTPNGTLSPDGILIFSGRPPFVAPLRPGTPVQVAPDSDALQAFRPKPRPTALLENSQRANLGGNTLAELALLRPRPRPISLQAEAEAAIEAAVGEAAETTISPLAVAASPTPGYRPRNFARVVEQSRETANASDGSNVASVSAAAATTTPSIPTRASVATQATINNAIRLNRINLIGIYGSSSSRRALVRLRNGRYVKVSVGDRLDGGKVVSITQTQLIYKKRGSNHALDVLPLG